jgi:hypothetical protein
MTWRSYRWNRVIGPDPAERRTRCGQMTTKVGSIKIHGGRGANNLLVLWWIEYADFFYILVGYARRENVMK